MTTRSSAHLSPLTPAQRAEVEDGVEAFEQAWQKGDHPKIADYLPADFDAADNSTNRTSVGELSRRRPEVNFWRGPLIRC